MIYLCLFPKLCDLNFLQNQFLLFSRNSLNAYQIKMVFKHKEVQDSQRCSSQQKCRRPFIIKKLKSAKEIQICWAVDSLLKLRCSSSRQVQVQAKNIRLFVTNQKVLVFRRGANQLKQFKSAAKVQVKNQLMSSRTQRGFVLDLVFPCVRQVCWPIEAQLLYIDVARLSRQQPCPYLL